MYSMASLCETNRTVEGRDTVSSVGLIRSRNLSFTDSAVHTCYFCHALALDERQVKFLPEYIWEVKNGLEGYLGDTSSGSKSTEGGPDNTVFDSKLAKQQDRQQGSIPHSKEVWFPGTHSDVYVLLFAPFPCCVILNWVEVENSFKHWAGPQAYLLLVDNIWSSSCWTSPLAVYGRVENGWAQHSNQIFDQNMEDMQVYPF